MGKIKVLGLALMAVFAFSAITAMAAQANSAPRWTVSGTTIGSGESVTVTGSTTGAPTLGNASVTFTSSGCTTHGNITGSGAGTPGTFTGSLHCNEVKVVGAPACQVHSGVLAAGTVATEPLTGTLAWLEATGDAKVGMVFKPENTKFVTLVVEGCALAGSYPVEGEEICEVTPVTKDEVNGTINCPSTPILKYWDNGTPRTEKTITQLKLKAAKSTFTAHFDKVHLLGEPLWGIEPG